MWQHRNVFLIGALSGLVLPAIIGLTFGGVSGAIGCFVWAGLARVVFVHHGTFLINSAAHIWGTQPYSEENSSRDSFWLAFLTFGEGYHNFHHTFQADYRNGHKWYHWDPSKWWIKVASWVGMTKELHRIPKKSIESQKMKTAFEKKSEGEDVSNELQAKLTQCVLQLRKGFTELVKRRDEYKLAKLERRKESKEAWKRRKEAHKVRIKECKERIAQARKDFKHLMESLKLDMKGKATVA